MMAGMVAAKDNTKVIAHRGYWKTEGSAQNSIRSLERASEIGAYGSEFDVHLTADNVLVVYHDNDIQGKHIQSCTYDELKDFTDDEKLEKSDDFAEQYEGKSDEFIQFISDESVAVEGSYKETWEYIEKDLNSLNRHSNMNLIFQKE